MNRRTAATAAVIGISVSLLAQGARRDGKWEVTTEMSMQGMPAGMMPPTTVTQCITKEEAADPQKAVPQPPAGRGGPPSDCKMSDYKADGNKVTYTMACTTPQPATVKGEIVYEGDKFTGTNTMNTTMGRGGQAMTMTMKLTGKRLGDCTK
jgi:hypothetical protein